ncbi:hypothetical protein COO60DRAFT_1707360 [Scenedesmus sp. NREL 46B-D3]|nr:hypothetical protein COO60DRAFT_1707360 [Scenedesmus sp. NREL 46B-D3]
MGAGQIEQVALDIFVVKAIKCCAGWREAMGRYVPQTVLSKDGSVLDVDLVLEASEQQDAAAAESSLSRVCEVLLQHAGALQMLFLLYTCEASTPIDAIHRMSLPQFKAMLHAAKVTSSSLPPEKLDEIFTSVQASRGAVSRKGQTQSNTAGFDLADFMVALVHVAHVRLTEQVLERCQIRRVRSRVLRVDVRYVAKHLQRWGLLGKEFSLPELAPVIIFAKQASTDPYKFELQEQPLALDYAEFERLLLGLALLQARVRKRLDAFDEVLGELLDSVYKKAGQFGDWH